MKIIELISKRSKNESVSTTETVVVEHDILSHHEVKQNDLTGVVFSEVQLINCIFLNVDFSGDEFFSSQIVNCYFVDCNFSNCDMHDATVLDSTFVKCNFQKCEFYNCTLGNCKFTESDISWIYGDELAFDGGEIVDSSINNSIINDSKFINNLFMNNKTFGLKVHASEMHYDGLLANEDEQIKYRITGIPNTE